MKKTIIPILLLSTVLTLTSCGGSKKEEKGNEEVAKTDSTQTAKEETPKADAASLSDPIKDFPKEALTVEANGMIFTTADNYNPGNAGIQFSELHPGFTEYKIKEAGPQTSKVNFLGNDVEIANYLIIPVKPGQTAKKGDIILGSWKGNMKRAVVLDDKDPAKPKVNFIDIDWDNPAKESNGEGYGQAQVQVEANSFHVLTAPWESGTSVAFKSGSDWKEGTVIKVGGDKVIVSGFGGVLEVVNKSDCKAIEIKPTCKAGDEVMAPWVGKYMKMKVLKIDTKFARVYLKDPYSDKPLIVPFGSVTASL